MYELGVFDKNTDELITSYLLNISSKDIFQVVGFALRGNCADLAQSQIKDLERIVGTSFNINSELYNVEISEIE